MGMYTALHFTAELKQETEDEVIEVLKFMNGDIEEPEIKPSHSFFDCERWRYLFQMDSFYFPADTHHTFRFDKITNSWLLTITSNIKNYNGEIEHFLDWIRPYIATKGFIGYTRYEEDLEPTLVFNPPK